MAENKKGISPLIATVLLIGFTIVLAALVFKWGNSIFIQLKENTECETLGEMTCNSAVEISAEDIEYSSSRQGFTKLVVNNDIVSTTLTSIKVQLEKKDRSTQTNSVKFRLEPGQSQDIVILALNFPPFYGFIQTTIDYVHVIPVITQDTSDGKSCQIICKSKALSIQNDGSENIKFVA